MQENPEGQSHLAQTGSRFEAVFGDDQALNEAEQFLLIREMHHRFANTLAILASAFRHEFSDSASPALRTTLAKCEARIVAFGKLNRVLVVGAADRQIAVGHYVERLCDALSEAMLSPLGIRCEVFAESGEFPAHQCERLGLIISELVTNTAKHGFRGRENKLVRVELRRQKQSWLCIVADNGIGTKRKAPGFGSKIIEQLVTAMGGALVRKSGPSGTAIIVTWKIQPAELAT